MRGRDETQGARVERHKTQIKQERRNRCHDLLLIRLGRMKAYIQRSLLTKNYARIELYKLTIDLLPPTRL